MRALTTAWVAGAAAAILLAAGCTGGTENVGAAQRPDRSSADRVTTLPAGGPGLRHLWADVTETNLGSTGQWTSKVELADIDGDGDVDLLFANGARPSPADWVRLRCAAQARDHADIVAALDRRRPGGIETRCSGTETLW